MYQFFEVGLSTLLYPCGGVNMNVDLNSIIDMKFDAEFGKGWWSFAHSYDRGGVIFVLIPN